MVIYRWGNTPLDEAIRFGHDEVADYLEEFLHRRKNSPGSGGGSRRSSEKGSPKADDGGSPSSGCSSKSQSPPTSEITHLNLREASSDSSSQKPPLVVGPAAPRTSYGVRQTAVTKPIQIITGSRSKDTPLKPTQNGSEATAINVPKNWLKHRL